MELTHRFPCGQTKRKIKLAQQGTAVVHARRTSAGGGAEHQTAPHQTAHCNEQPALIKTYNTGGAAHGDLCYVGADAAYAAGACEYTTGAPRIPPNLRVDLNPRPNVCPQCVFMESGREARATRGNSEPKRDV